MLKTAEQRLYVPASAETFSETEALCPTVRLPVSAKTRSSLGLFQTLFGRRLLYSPEAAKIISTHGMIFETRCPNAAD